MAYSIKAIKLFRLGYFPRFQDCVADLEPFNPYACNLYISHRWISQQQADDGRFFRYFSEMLLRLLNRMTQKKFLNEPRNHGHALFDVDYLFDRTLGYDLYRNIIDRTPEDDEVLSHYLDVSQLYDEQVVEIISYLNDIHIWFDYTCIPQEPRSEKDKVVFDICLSKMHWILEHSYTICLWQGPEFFRGWCVLEYLIATQLGARAMYKAEPCDIRSMQISPELSQSRSWSSFTLASMDEGGDPLMEVGLGDPRNHFDSEAPTFVTNLVGVQSVAAILEVFSQNRVSCTDSGDLHKVATLIGKYNTKYAGFTPFQPVFNNRCPLDFRTKLFNQLRNLYHGGEKMFSPVLFEHVAAPDHPINQAKYQNLLAETITQPYYRDNHLEFHPRLLNVFSPEVLILNYFFVKDFGQGLVSNEGVDLVEGKVPKQDLSLFYKYPTVRSSYDYNLGVRNNVVLKELLKKEIKKANKKGCAIM